ncbi:Apoptosis-inducing factor 2 [Termitomyces sp. J132]|nr:hypothetical protein H2248_003899 [Termitomyces sp. 'cryptogamus']KNZ81712.1 Apoptosis-inducing factor 2 [Termitomyces sp. J132]
MSSPASSSSPARKTIVIIGGGAGALVARRLSTLLNSTTHNVDLILITARPHFQHYIGSIRAAVTPEGGFAAQVLVPFDRLLINGNGTIITAEVTAFSEHREGEGGTVMLSNGESVRWDALVLATGSIWEGPLDVPKSRKEALAWFGDWQDRFEEARDILLVGGGSVAVEYAGEIKDLDPSKNVTIVHRDTMLLNKTYPNKFRKDVERRLRARRVDLLLGDTVSEDAFTSAKITTRNGTTLTPDLVIPCRGPRPNTSIISAALGADALTPAGHVKVLNTFQLPNHPHIFACGDIADLNEQRQIGKHRGHADVVSKNVLALLDGHKPSAIYKGTMEMIFITIGKNGGAGYVDFLWGLCFGDWFVSLAKSRSLLVSKVRGYLGL